MRNLIFTECNGWYSEYRPLFEFFAKKAYPDTDVLVNELPYYDDCHFYAACHRLFVQPTGSDTWDEVYITDVDMLLLPGENLFHYHRAKMKETGLCYNNTGRLNEPMARERITGLHYATRSWYRKTYTERLFALESLEKRRIGKRLFDDEVSMKTIIEKSNLALPPMQPRRLLHFGIHLGTLRAYRHTSRQTINTQCSMRVTPERARNFLDVIADKEFGDLVYNIKNSTILWQLKTLHSFCMRRVKEL